MRCFSNVSSFGVWMLLAAFGYAAKLADLSDPGQFRASIDTHPLTYEVADCLAKVRKLRRSP